MNIFVINTLCVTQGSNTGFEPVLCTSHREREVGAGVGGLLRCAPYANRRKFLHEKRMGREGAMCQKCAENVSKIRPIIIIIFH